MPQQFLNGAQITSGGEKVAGKTVSQSVRGNGVGEPQCAAQTRYHHLGLARRQAATAYAAKNRILGRKTKRRGAHIIIKRLSNDR